MNTIERSTKAANALGGKTAKACENCLVKRARWFCTADDAFLCQACDASVHSANQLASKHERFRLETSSYKIIDSQNVATNSNNPPLPSSSLAATWHRGFTKKPRTPRHPKLSTSQSPSLQPSSNPIDPLVPEINSHEEWPFHQYENRNEEQSVPVFNPSFEDEFDCVKLLGEEGIIVGSDDHDLDIGSELFGSCNDVDFTVDNMLEEEDNSFCGISRVDYLGLERSAVKVEGDDDEDSDEAQAAIASHFDPQLDMEFDWDFDFNNTNSMTDEGIKLESDGLDEATKVPCLDSNTNNSYINNSGNHSHDKYDKRSSNTMMLKLDYEEVIASWASQDHSPWIDRARPHNFNIDEFMVACMGGVIGARSGAEREARVSRYREKRRTRLFSKKIRYQVRKLNAQKRPRIKGRFVKRTTLITTTSCTFSGISIPYK